MMNEKISDKKISNENNLVSYLNIIWRFRLYVIKII